MFSCEFCETFKNNFFTEHLQQTAFESGKKTFCNVKLEERTEKILDPKTSSVKYSVVWKYLSNFRRIKDRVAQMGTNGPSKTCGRQSLKNFTWSILEYLHPNIMGAFLQK